ncbi:MAG: hypothetical protein H6738_18255 [Alphaproteobacteria bacterium]|nr:hypothetical protein [Alphaproteobacteria bacterium]
MAHFVLAYDRRIRLVVERRDFAGTQRDEAWDERDRMVAAHAGDPEMEVVMLGSESESTLRATHGRYFEAVAPTLVDEP